MRRRGELPAHHRRVVHALQSGGPAVPDSLLRRVEALEVEAAVTPRRRAGTVAGRSALAGAVALVAALVLVVVLSLGGPGGASVVEAAQLNARPAQHAAPARSFAGVDYPNWSVKFGWFALGRRADELGGRETTTTFYRHTHHRIGYTVISGKALQPPDDAQVLTVKGIELHRFRLGEQDAVSFVRNGHTCVLSGKVHRASTLVKLATTE
jgi:hypothetical protein